MNRFNHLNRNKYLEELEKNPPELIVVGGGITGAGILLDATVRGINSALFEMQDFAEGTSSRSTKLIHGGLRYLKNLEFGLVREVGRERAIVFKNAPHITRPEPMVLPIIKGGSIGFIGAVIGMWIYDLLAGVKPSERRRIIRKESVLALEPNINNDLLKYGVYYYEYRSDDARLTAETIKEAVSRGSKAVNYCKVESFLYDQNKISGVVVKDLLFGKSYTIKTKVVVNACGPFADLTDAMDRSAQKDKLFLTKGVHIVVDSSKFPIGQSMYMDTEDGRMIFTIPREGKVYIGTTDTTYKGDIKNPEASIEDYDYLVKAVAKLFPSYPLSVSDIESGWCGLRPLIKQKNKSKPGEISRKDELFHYTSGLITITGGKLTGYRKMAERSVDLVVKKLEEIQSKTFPRCTTENIPLSGAIPMSLSVEQYEKEKRTELSKLGISEHIVKRWVYKFGTNTDKIVYYYKQIKTESNSTLPKEIQAELMYCIDYEMCMEASDYFVRRTGDYYFNIEQVRNHYKSVIEFMKNEMGWSEDVVRKNTEHIENLLNKYPVV